MTDTAEHRSMRLLDPDHLRRNLPNGPGVYLFKDGSDQVLYVGKAKNLRKRVLSYFKPRSELPTKTSMMITKAAGLDYILTSTEKEAFILERNLIKGHMPRYNIVLRDDKQYPCLRLDVQEPFPRLTVVRKIKKDGSLYFGPFSSANSVRSTLKLIDRIFQLRKCKGRDLPKRSRPCLNYQLNRCLGACVHKVDPEDYGEVVDQVRLFLEGRNLELVKNLRDKMRSASERLDFEKAAVIRDQIGAVERTIERQHVVSPGMEDRDVIGLARDNGLFQLVILFVRKGKLLGSRDYLIDNEGGTASEVMEAFLKQYYGKEAFIPKQIFVSEPVDDMPAIMEWISELAGAKVRISRPMRGEKSRLVGIAVANARNLLEHPKDSGREDLIRQTRALLQLKNEPRTIEGIDISNLYGDQAVGTVVSFSNGRPDPTNYRNYRIRGVKGIDDYAMMSELITRRLSKQNPPDLILVDGGKGHLLTVKRIVDGLFTDHGPDVVSLAKADEGRGEKEDKIYLPGRKNPLLLPGGHPVLHLLMRIRDEAHRRAVTYHRKIRGREFKGSLLEKIPGVGGRRSRSLLRRFGDLEGISRAGVEELTSVPGITRPVAENIILFLQKIIHS